VAGKFQAGSGCNSAVFWPTVTTGKITKVILSSGLDESTDFDLKLESTNADRHNEAN
jgi:hypothetical protein